MSQIYGTSIYNCDFLKFIISVRGSYFDYWSWVPKIYLHHCKHTHIKKLSEGTYNSRLSPLEDNFYITFTQ
jgi:hypothetical protein